MMAPVEMNRNPLNGILKYFGRGLERGADHPEERNDHHNAQEQHYKRDNTFIEHSFIHGRSSFSSEPSVFDPAIGRR
ncbi:hypothetical protein D3C74_401020 [compost metagenome]